MTMGFVDSEHFVSKEVDFCGINSILITPNHIGSKYTKETLVFRSSIWAKNDGKLLSASFPKFFNFGEKPDLYPNPESYSDWVIQEKIDGSTAILDYVNGQYSIRTRGTASYKTQENHSDFEGLFQLTDFKEFQKDNPNYSFVFEIVTPNNVIVINSGTINYYLLDVFDKTNYKSLGFNKVQEIAQKFNLDTPKTYKFATLAEVAASVKLWKGQEGVVLSYNNFQNKVKLKSDWYLQCHKIKSQLNTLEAVVDLFITYNYPSYNEFYAKICETFDFEIAEQLKRDISKICDAFKEVVKIREGMESFVEKLDGKPRKDQALSILSAYGKTNRSQFVFNILDGKKLGDDAIKKLIFQCL